MASRSRAGRECTAPQQKQTERDELPVEATKLAVVEVRDVMDPAKLTGAVILSVNPEGGLGHRWKTPTNVQSGSRSSTLSSGSFLQGATTSWPKADSSFPWSRQAVVIQGRTTSTKGVRLRTDGTECPHQAAWGHSAQELSDDPFPFPCLSLL